MDKSINKFERFTFYVFIFSIPIQSRFVFFKWTLLFNEWISAFIYVTDFLIGALFIFWFLRIIRSRGYRGSFSLRKIKSTDWALIIFFVVSILSIFSAKILGLSIFRIIKLAEFIGLLFYIRNNTNLIFDFDRTIRVIIASGFFQALLGIAQYIKQGSVGLNIFGESSISLSTANVAIFKAGGLDWLRAYGTTPHPNVLAAWLFVAIFAFYFYYFKSNNISKFSFSAYSLILFGFFFTFSRVIIGLWIFAVALILVFMLFHKKMSKQILKKVYHIVSLSIIIVFLFCSMYWPQVSSRIHLTAGEGAVAERILYNQVAEKITAQNPILGIGIGQFVSSLMDKFRHFPARFYQPVHNIYLLISSEIGIFGLAAFLLFLIFSIRDYIRQKSVNWLIKFSYLAFFFSILIFGLFDHFLWTLQPGSLILWTSLAYIFHVDSGL